MDELSLRQLNDGDDEDAAIRRAMALSLRDSESTRTGRTGNAAASTSPAPPFKRSASTASTAGTASTASEEPQVPTSEQRDSSQAAAGAPPATSASGPSLLTLDRKAMEAERLARRQKQLEANNKSAQQVTTEQNKSQNTSQIKSEQPSQRLAPTPTPTKPATKRKAAGDIIVIDDDDATSTGAPSSRAAPLPRRRKIDDHGSKPDHVVYDNNGTISDQGLGRGKGKSSAGGRTLSSWSPSEAASPFESVPAPAFTAASTAVPTPPSSSLSFAKGVVKKTWARGQPRRGDDITIDEVWQKDQLELAILSSFQWDDEWMMSHLDITKTRLLLIAFAADDKQKEEMSANVPSDRIRFCFPRMQTMGNMHSKLQLLKFPGFLRIVVPTGNLTPYDWGETGTIENMVFIIDLPRLSKEGRATAVSTPFREDLCYFLKAQGVDDGMINSIRNFDYAETARYAFVHTMSGSHTDDAATRTGYAGLGRAVKALGWDTTKAVQLDYICSSVGALSDDLTMALYYACQGDAGMKELELRTSRARKPKAKGQSQLTPASSQGGPQSGPKDCMRLYFPSQETVSKSAGGVNRKWWEAPAFPREMFRDGQNVRTGVLLHTKLLLVRQPEPQCRGWAYVGSANMSESAWGRMVKDRASGKIKMSCRSWECGVLVPASMDEPVSSSSSPPPSLSPTEDAHMLDVFRGTLPVPISVPASRYGNGKQPWFFLERTH